MTDPITWTTQRIKVADLKPYERNPRKITKDKYQKLVESIQRLGYMTPIVAQPDGTIIGGHARKKALQELKIKEVDVRIPNRALTENEYKEALLRDNVSNGEWDMDMLAADFDMDFLDFVGLEIPDLKNLTTLETVKDEAPDVQETAKSVKGDVWILGKHRLMCGDSTVATDVEKLLNGVKPHLMVTDPPYGVEYDADWRNRVHRKDGSVVGGLAVGKVENDDRADWSDAWALFPGHIAYVWHAALFAPVVAESLQKNGFKIRTQIIWAKSNFAIGRGDYHWQHEPCWYAVKGTGNWTGDRKQTTLWQIDKPQKSETGHSTQKPVECMLRPIRNNSSEGQAVYEPFSGSGTTIIAGEQIGRHVYAMEINPLYVDVAVRRWQNLTGQQAINESTGNPFGD